MHTKIRTFIHWGHFHVIQVHNKIYANQHFPNFHVEKRNIQQSGFFLISLFIIRKLWQNSMYKMTCFKLKSNQIKTHSENLLWRFLQKSITFVQFHTVKYFSKTQLFFNYLITARSNYLTTTEITPNHDQGSCFTTGH